MLIDKCQITKATAKTNYKNQKPTTSSVGGPCHIAPPFLTVSDSVLVRSAEPETEKKKIENQLFAGVPLNNSPIKKMIPVFFFLFQTTKFKNMLKTN